MAAAATVFDHTIRPSAFGADADTRSTWEAKDWTGTSGAE